MNINDKIKQILIERNLTPSYFADEIGVQRSSISHILSGRNRPSFDIIQKIIRRFPDLGYEWIMEEEPQPHSSSVQLGYSTARTNAQPAPVNQRDRFITQPAAISSPMNMRNQRDELPPLLQSAKTSSSESQSFGVDPTASTSVEKKVERILIFYTDGSFREYAPSAH